MIVFEEYIPLEENSSEQEVGLRGGLCGLGCSWGGVCGIGCGGSGVAGCGLGCK